MDAIESFAEELEFLGGIKTLIDFLRDELKFSKKEVRKSLQKFYKNLSKEDVKFYVEEYY